MKQAHLDVNTLYSQQNQEKPRTPRKVPVNTPESEEFSNQSHQTSSYDSQAHYDEPSEYLTNT
jgi:hypothetical protein